MNRNVLFITVDQWRGDCLSALGHPVLTTPSLDRLAAQGTLFANHWANAAPCGPSRACLYTGTYLHHHRSVNNGTPLDRRFTNVALLAREAGYDPVLFGYTDTSLDPRSLPADDPRLRSYEQVLPGIRAVVHDPWEAGSQEWGRWLAAQGVDVPARPQDLYRPIPDFPGTDGHGSTWAPAQFGADQSETAFMVEALTGWLDRHGQDPFFVHASFIRPHPPRRNPVGYHDLYDADALPPFVGAPTKQQEADAHPLNQVLMNLPFVGAPEDERERRQTRATYYGAQREVDDQLGRLFAFLDTSGLASNTLVVLTSDHGEMGGDHWLFEKFGLLGRVLPRAPHHPGPRCGGRPGPGTGGAGLHRVGGRAPHHLPVAGHRGPLAGRRVRPSALPPESPDEGGRAPDHWRTEAHWSWNFSHPVTHVAEEFFGIPMAHCALDVSRGTDVKYVQFAADCGQLPPLLFDLSADPGQLHDLVREGGASDLGWAAAQRLLQWRMRNDDRTLSGTMLTPSAGAVSARDAWR